MSDAKRDPLDAGLSAAFGNADGPPSVLTIIERKTGEAPRVSLEERDSESGRTPVIDPGAEDVRSIPLGKGNYQLLGELARGGMGVVLKGHDTDLGRDVALKVLHKKLADQPATVQRFVEEAQIGGQLQHPGIVPVYELGIMADERPYFTMKLVKGKTLSALLAARESASSDRRRMLDIFESVCQTMAYAHSRGVIHRDLKPANVMVGAFGEVQVVDWGLAKVLPRGGQADERKAKEARTVHTVLETVRSDPQSDSSHSLAGSVMGTPAYMPPEQAAGHVEKLDERSDVFSLGAILCEILTDAPPYSGEHQETVLQAANARLDQALERLAACGADPELVDLATQCLMPAQAARPRDAELVAERLRRHLESVEERAHRAQIEAAVQRRAKWLWSALVAVVVIFVAAGLWYRQWQGTQQSRRLGQYESEIAYALTEAESHRDRGRYDEALAAARRGQTIGSTHGLGTDTSIDQLVLDLEAEQEAIRVAVEQAEKRERFLETVEDLSRAPLTLYASAERVAEQARRYAEAFRSLGVDVDSTTPEEAAETLRAAGVAEQAIPALDSWSRDLGSSFFGAQDPFDLLAVADAVDPDPFRGELRQLIRTNDRAALERLASSPAALEASPASVLTMVWLLDENELEQYIIPVCLAGRRNHPDDHSMNLFLGMTLMFAGADPWRALQYVTAAESIQPREPLAHITKAGLLAALDRPDLALPALDAALEYAVEEELLVYSDVLVRGFRTLGEAYAVEKLESLWRERADAPKARLALAPILQEMGDHRGAIALLREALQREPNNAIMTSLAMSLLMEGEYEEALELMRVATRVPESGYGFLSIFAWSLSTCPEPSLRQPEEAIELAERACAHRPDHHRPTEALGAALYRAGRHEDAVGVLEWAHELHGRPCAPADYFLAMALFRLGDEVAARATLERALRWHRSDAGNPDRDALWRQQLDWIRAEAEALLDG